MVLFEAIVSAGGVVAQPTNMALILLATLFGLLMGMLPGLGGTVTLALLIPLTFGMDPIVAFMILAAAKGATNFGGSVTAILINTPGASPNAATILDGFPMARDGRGGEAIGASAGASAFGAIVGIIILFSTIPILMGVLFLFGPPEIFWLAIWGLTIISVVVKGSVVKGLISASLGAVLAVHGLNIYTNTRRFTYDLTFMIDGWKLVPALIGLFAVAEVISLVSKGESISDKDATVVRGGQWTGLKQVFVHRWLFLRSSFVGFLTGMIPGVGGAAANFIAYFQAVQTSSDQDKFGTGDVRGVIASESSNDAKDGGGFVPTLAFGIPGTASMAVLLGAFILHGLNPGPTMFQNNLDIVMVIIFALLISNIVTSSIGVLTASYLVRITSIDIRVLAPLIVGVSFFGAYAINNSIWDVYITLAFGILGVIMIQIGMARVPLVLALVLVPIMETNLYRSIQVSRGELTGFVDSWVSILLILLVFVSLFLPYIRYYVKGAIGGKLMPED